ncbi:MAG: 2-hydroxyacyl-CoA dehydratase, partial [archaeon]|nr:2-hydroxyacyl-CoA dehydratase [archaeon]
RQFDNSNSIDKILHDIIDAVFSQFDNMYNFGVEKGVPSDECYGIKVLHGMYAHKGKNLSSALFQSIRCSAFEKCYESCVKYAPGIFIDVPPYDNEYSHELAVKEVYHAANELEKVTGHKITNSDLRNIAEITNSCKDYFEKILNIALGDKYPIEPYTFSEIIALLDICFQDFLSNPLRFKNILKNIVIEMEDKIKKGKYLDLSKSPKILFTTRYGGWDHIVGDYICSNGGRVIYADWFMYGFMNRIKTTGDMFENYATFLQFQGMGFGRDNKELVEHTLDFVLKNNIDAVIYNQLFGCHSLTTAYSRLRKALLKEEIPSTLVSFNNVGENREQTKTRCIALMELLK